MKCTECGYELNPNSKFCQGCGAKVVEAPACVCPACGASVKEGAKFCGKCGSKFDAEPSPQAETVDETVAFASVGMPSEPADIICASCGTRLAAGKKFCNSCGTPVNSDTVESPRQTSLNQTPSVDDDGATRIVGRAAAMSDKSPKKKKKTGLVVTLVALISLLLVAGGITAYCYVNDLWFFADSADTDTDSDDEKSTSSGETDSEKKPGSKKDSDSGDVTSDDDTGLKDNDDSEDDASDDEIINVNVNPVDDSVIRNIIANNSSYTTYGVYVYNLSNGYEYGYNHRSSFLASAMGQVVILDTVSQLAKQNNIDIANETMRFDYFANGKEAPNSKNENGQYLSIKKYVEDVAVYGDNNKSNQLVDYIAQYGVASDNNGFDVINRMAANRGYGSTSINKKIFVDARLVDESVPASTTTPYDVAHMFASLINKSSFGSKSYMMNIFRSSGNKGEPIGLRKYIPAHYISCSTNAINSQVTNDVAIISDGDTEIVVAIFGNTPKDMTGVENNSHREKVQELIIEHILYTQFEQ